MAVPSNEAGSKFFKEILGFIEKARRHPGYAILAAAESTIGLVAKPARSTVGCKRQIAASRRFCICNSHL
jgi:hypothetical protein